MLRRAPVLVLGALVAATLAATLAPTEAANRPQPVKGGKTQAYQSTYHVKPKAAVVPSVRYYLTGEAQDQVNKLTETPSATFSRTKPTGTTDITQQTSPFVSVATSGSQDEGSAFWSAPYKGSLDGTMTIRWYWASSSPLSDEASLAVTVWADPGTKDEKAIGTGLSGPSLADGQPHVSTLRLQVKGKVAKELRVMARARYVDGSNDITAHYGSVGSPSWFELPRGKTPPPRLPSTEPVKDRNPLVISATRIGRNSMEPTIGVTKQGNAFMTAADFDAISPANGRTLIYSSTDGNTSWHNVTPLVAGQPVSPVTLDPYLYVDPDTDRVYNDDLTAACSFLTWSDDQGKTWTQGNPLACESPVDDHQTLVTGVPPAGVTTTGYPKVVYYCVNKVADVQCARSTDGGMTFVFTGGIPFEGVKQGEEGNPPEFCGGLHGHISTDPAGRVLLPKDHCGIPALAVSDDAAGSWRVSAVSKVRVAPGPVDPSVASDSAGNLYYLWLGADDLLPYMAVSRDHGRTWGPTLLVAPPGLVAANFPTIAADGKGHVVISFPGTTSRSEAAGRPWNYYVAATDNALADRPTFHSTTANPVADPIHRGACLDRCAGMFDFVDVIIAPRTGELWAAAVDTCVSAKCLEATATQTASPDASGAAGLAIRQLSGPGLRRR